MILNFLRFFELKEVILCALNINGYLWQDSIYRPFYNGITSLNTWKNSFLKKFYLLFYNTNQMESFFNFYEF